MASFCHRASPRCRGPRRYAPGFSHVFANFRVKEFGLQPAATEQRGDIPIEHGNWNATFQPKNSSPELPVGGTYVTVYARLSDGSIRRIRDTFNGMP